MSKMPKIAEPAREIVTPPLLRTFRVDELKEGERRLIEANRAEREAIAALLDLVALDRLSFTFRSHRRGEGRLGLRGTLCASVTQTCVVSLEPVESTIEVPVEIEFWPYHLIEDRAETVDEATSHGTLDWPEPIVDHKIDLGTVIYETLATALDPYPKREGVSFEWSDANVEAVRAEKTEGPFGALKRLK
ncbi:MAG TPA: DUF177 domain-containing protein [Methyloceanibacter sp.]|nr:DUF177 domain-containing protein [Methyloceanibacter sp.]